MFNNKLNLIMNPYIWISIFCVFMIWITVYSNNFNKTETFLVMISCCSIFITYVAMSMLHVAHKTIKTQREYIENLKKENTND